MWWWWEEEKDCDNASWRMRCECGGRRKNRGTLQIVLFPTFYILIPTFPPFCKVPCPQTMVSAALVEVSSTKDHMTIKSCPRTTYTPLTHTHASIVLNDKNIVSQSPIVMLPSC